MFALESMKDGRLANSATGAYMRVKSVGLSKGPQHPTVRENE